MEHLLDRTITKSRVLLSDSSNSFFRGLYSAFVADFHSGSPMKNNGGGHYAVTLELTILPECRQNARQTAWNRGK